MRAHFEWVAENDARARAFQAGFHGQILRLYRRFIPPGARVLEWGCGRGDLLAALEPSRGLGCDFSSAMLRKAEAAHGGAGLEFRCAEIVRDVITEKFDHILLDYLTGYLDDLQPAFRNLLACSHARTRLHITTLNTPWLFPLNFAARFGLVVRQPPSNWLSRQDLTNLLELSGWEVVTSTTEQLIPFEIPWISTWLNRWLVRLPGFRHFGMSLQLVARPKIAPRIRSKISCSVIIPARNEAGNIRAALERVPVLGKKTEIIFVEGHSRDETWEAISEALSDYTGPHELVGIRQPGDGKWDAVRAGLVRARGDVVVIQDADLTAPPEDLPKFFEAITGGLAEMANGSRLVYPMESRAMRFLNLLGNKFFSSALTYILGQPIKDSLCGTKMLLRSDCERLLARTAAFGDFDPFGDFNLLFGSALLGLKIRDIPVRYRERTYGRTNISRFRHGLVLLRMTGFGLSHVRMVPARSPRPGEPWV